MIVNRISFVKSKCCTSMLGRRDWTRERRIEAHRGRPLCCLGADHVHEPEIEVEYLPEEGPPETSVPKPMMSSVPTHANDRSFKVILAVISKLWQVPQHLESFISSRPEPTSMPFILWLADKEAVATGGEKERLAALCELLVIARERLDDQRMDVMYQSTLGALADRVARGALLSSPNSSGLLIEKKPGKPVDLADDASRMDSNLAAPSLVNSAPQQSLLQMQQRREQALVALSSDPVLYAVQLSEQLTGLPVMLDGYTPMYDLILKAAPPAALSPAGIQKAHAEAAELAVDLKGRRKRSVASLIGRVKMTSEQADQLKAGTAAARILDMLLALPTQRDRVGSLPDCFTPPETAAGAASSGGDTQAPQQEGTGPSESGDSAEGEATEELWCTPAQLLSEVEVRIRSVSTGSANPSVLMLPTSSSELTGPDLVKVLEGLRSHIKQAWLQAMQVP